MLSIDTGLMSVLDADRQSVDAGSLGALGCTGVYHGLAPKGSELPYVRFQQMAAPRDNTMGDSGVDVVNAVYAVLAVDEGDDHERAGAIAARVKQLLHKKPLPFAGHMRTLIDRELDLPEHAEGRLLQQLGANYRVWVYE